MVFDGRVSSGPFRATRQNFFVCVDKSKYKSIVVRHVNG
jgi:hypothetical protein